MNIRRLSLVLTLAAVFIFAALGWLVQLSRNTQAAPAPSSDAAFKGKVLLIHTNYTMISSIFFLEKAQVQKIGDQSFLVGRGAGDGQMGGWFKDRTVRLQMGHIVSIIEFDDLKEALKALQSGAATQIGIGGHAAPVPVEAAPAGAAPAPSSPRGLPAPARKEP